MFVSAGDYIDARFSICVTEFSPREFQFRLVSFDLIQASQFQVGS